MEVGTVVVINKGANKDSEGVFICRDKVSRVSSVMIDNKVSLYTDNDYEDTGVVDNDFREKAGLERI